MRYRILVLLLLTVSAAAGDDRRREMWGEDTHVIVNAKMGTMLDTPAPQEEGSAIFVGVPADFNLFFAFDYIQPLPVERYVGNGRAGWDSYPRESPVQINFSPSLRIGRISFPRQVRFGTSYYTPPVVYGARPVFVPLYRHPRPGPYRIVGAGPGPVRGYAGPGPRRGGPPPPRSGR